MVLSPFRIRLLRWLAAIERRWIPNEKFGDVTVLYATSDVAKRAELSKQVKLAFTVVKLKAPAWYRRVQAEVASLSLIELGPSVGLARFDLNRRDCVVNTTRLFENAQWAVVDLALVLVHEAAHGWLFRHGVRATTPEQVQRVEQVCNHAEACLVARIPEVPLLAEIVKQRQSRIPDSYSAPLTAKRKHEYFRALIRGALGLPSRAVRPNER